MKKMSDKTKCIADLSKADLSGADLSGANLSGANLSGADLRNVNELRQQVQPILDDLEKSRPGRYSRVLFVLAIWLISSTFIFLMMKLFF